VACGPERIAAAAVTDDPPLSPELVLVSPPELASRARARLADPIPFVAAAPARRADLGRGEIAAVYAVALAVTLVPLALTLATVPARP
jgi:hypothetical protein